jgi:hypothetical protein
MYRIGIAYNIRHGITFDSLIRRSGILDLGRYCHNRVLCWAGHVPRAPMSRAPRHLLIDLVAHPRPIGCLEVAFSRTLKKALKHNDHATWSAIVRGRPLWRQLGN